MKSIVFTITLSLGTAASRVHLRNFVVNTFTGPGSKSRTFALLLIVANLKNVPFAWHYRIFSSVITHFFISKPNIPPALAASALFTPVITSSRSPLTECDYNLHKSNSTYFSDLDITRSHLVSCLLEPGVAKLHHNVRERLVLDKDGNPNRGRFSVMLGSVMCSFKREIGMYEGYEMWSRILCWDRKWIYVVSHFVKKGTVKPSAYILTDGGWFGKKGYKKVVGPSKGADVDEKAIFATGISKYVVKLGRLTIHPEVVLNASGILPERPGGWATMQGGTGEATPEVLEAVSENGVPPSGDVSEDAWDWKRVEAEKEKGLKFVEHFAALDELHHEFSGSKASALGKYTDFLFW